MSILIKIRNLFLVLKIFYWFSFKASIKAVKGRDIGMYVKLYLGRISFGQRRCSLISKQRCMSFKARRR